MAVAPHPVDPTYACIPTGINRYMHEFQNRPTRGSSDCHGCARYGAVVGRTHEASAGRSRTGKALLGGAHDGARPPEVNVVNPCGYRSETGCAAYDGRGAGHGAASWQPLPVHGSIVDETRNAEDRREVPGGSGGSPEVPGVVDLRRVFASREWRSGATFSKLL